MICLFVIFLINFSFSDSAPLDASDPDAIALLGPNCKSEEELTKVAKCSSLLVEYDKKSKILNATDTKLNDTKLTGFITLCKKTMICLEPTCLSEAVKDSIYVSCLSAEIKNTEFFSCVTKISEEKPDLSSYDCLKPGDYASGVIETSVLESKPECLKTVLEGFCGEEAANNFDENVSKLLSVSMLAVEIKARLNGTSAE